MAERSLCKLCGEPMPCGEEMFNYHGYSGRCPKKHGVASEPAPTSESEKIAQVFDKWGTLLNRPGMADDWPRAESNSVTYNQQDEKVEPTPPQSAPLHDATVKLVNSVLEARVPESAFLGDEAEPAPKMPGDADYRAFAREMVAYDGEPSLDLDKDQIKRKAEPAVERPTEYAKRFHENSGIAIPLYATMREGNPAIPNHDEILAAVYKLMTAFAESELSSLRRKRDALKEELQHVLDDWNSLVKASKSPTNGGAVGHVAKIVREVEELKARAEKAEGDYAVSHTKAEMFKRSAIANNKEVEELKAALRHSLDALTRLVGICRYATLDDEKTLGVQWEARIKAALTAITEATELLGTEEGNRG